MDTNAKIFMSVVGILLLGVAGIAIFRSSGANVPAVPGKYDTFATCLKDKGLFFYGAFWCPHCQGQKKLFGSSAKLLPYIECSTSDGQGKLQVCNDAGINSYPTWKLSDGSVLPNENGAGITLETLSVKSACELPK